VIVAAAAVLGVRELSIAFQERGIRFPLVPGRRRRRHAVAAYFRGEGALAAAAGADHRGRRGVAADRPRPRATCATRAPGSFAAVYVPFLAGFAMLMTAADHGAQRALVFLILGDLQRHRRLRGRRADRPASDGPVDLPKKSWEGLAGSLLTAAAGGRSPW